MQTHASRLLLVVLLALAGCSDDSSSTGSAGTGSTDDTGGTGSGGTAPTTTAITVTPSLGLISNGLVRLQQLGGGWEANGGTGSGGTTLFNVPLNLAGPFLITVCGGAEARYFDEGLSALSALGDSQCLRAAVPDLSRANVGVTALTEAAVRRLEQQGDLATTTSGDVTTALEFVRGQTLPEVTDLLQAPALVGSAADLAQLPADDAGRYALKLALLAKTASALAATRGGSSQPAWAIGQALGRDLADGVFDGQEGGTLLFSPVYDIGLLTDTYDAQLAALADDSANLTTLVASLGTTASLATPVTPGSALSWQGSWLNATGLSKLNSVASGGNIGNIADALGSGTATTGPCSFSLDNGTLTLSDVTQTFNFAQASHSYVGGIRSYVMTRTVLSSGYITSGMMSIPVTIETLTTVTLRTQNDVVLDVALQANGITNLGVTVLDANATCKVSSPT